MRFFISCYGSKYVPLLTVCLASLRAQHPSDAVSVYVDDLKDHEVLLLVKSFPSVEFKSVPTVASGMRDRRQAISSKLEHWCEFLSSVQDDEIVVFLDADLLIHRNIASSLPEQFDFLYTWKPESVPLNTGVVVVRNSSVLRAFMSLWHSATMEIARDERALQKAAAQNGAGDQHALFELLGLRRGQWPPVGEWVRKFEFGELLFYGAACDELNQTNSVPVDSGARIFHYKAGWRPILLEDAGYGKYRTEENSAEMHRYWESTYRAHNARMLKDHVLAAVAETAPRWNLPGALWQGTGILPSEGVCVAALVVMLNIDTVIVVGAGHAPFADVLARVLAPRQAALHSHEEAPANSLISIQKRGRRARRPMVYHGDSATALRDLLSAHAGRKIALVLAGVAGANALDLLSECIVDSDDIVIAFIHGLPKLGWGRPTEDRYLIHQYYDRLFLTDDDDYVELTQHLDTECAVSVGDTGPSAWRPYHLDHEYIGSYGPTLAVVLPTERDRVRAQRRLRSTRSSVLTRAAKRVLGATLGESATRMIAPFAARIRKQTRLLAGHVRTRDGA